ncbi:MAG: hypothetical protein K0S93_1485 [Nitrososphaeraceae archaeon]|nr:hypothetical protein [Nitrososphaeraceae archaeon]
MPRKLAIFVICLVGFGIGFGAYLLFPNITKWFQTNMPQFLDASIIGALIAGIIGSIISTITIMTWANRNN